MTQLSFHPGYSGGMLLAAAAAALLLTALFYRRAFAALSVGQWITLYLLRSAALVVVLLLLFRPLLTVQRELEQRKHIVFLIDRSASMSIADRSDGSTRLQQAADRVGNWMTELEDDFDLHLLTFSGAAQSLERPGQLATLQADGQVTSLSRALVAGAKVVPSRDLEAMFLLSDGVHNSAADPLDVAPRLGCVVHSVGVGSGLREGASYRDARIAGVEAPPQLAVDNLVLIKGYVEAVGYPGRVAKLTLLEDDRAVDEQELVLDDAEGAQQVTFEFRPDAKGLHTYTVSLPAAAGEKIAENNRRSTNALVIDAHIRVLYVEGTLRAEYGALTGRFLSKDPNLEFCALVQTRPNVFLQRSNIDDLTLNAIPSPEQLATFDVIILGDLDSSYLQPAQMAAIAERVRAGGGLLMIGGYHSLGPGGYADTPLADLLPVFVGDRDIGQLTDPFLPQLTPQGRQHPIFTNIAAFFPGSSAPPEIDGLPPLDGCARVLGAKPAASVLAVHPRELAQESAMPVLAVQPIGEGRVAVFTGDTTRHWHQTLRTLDRETPFLRFWGQTVRWLAGRQEQFETEAGIVATSDKSQYLPEAEVTITAVVRGKQGAAAANARVTAIATGPGGASQEFSLSPIPGPAGNYRGTFQPNASGPCEIEVAAAVDDLQLTAEKIAVIVGRPNLEYDELTLDQRRLMAISQLSGGRYEPLSTADRLIERLQRQRENRRVQYELTLAWPPLMWALFVGLLTTEWLLRRRFSLR